MIKCGLCPLYGHNEGCPGKLSDGACVRKLQEKLMQLMAKQEPTMESQPAAVEENLFYKAVQEELSKLKRPELPPFRVNGDWGGKIYGSDGNWAIMVDGIRHPINNTEYMILSRYAKALRKYKQKIQAIKHGVGIHKDGVCPVCGERYAEISAPAAPISADGSAKKEWKCLHCGSHGIALYQNQLKSIYNLFDRKGRTISRDVKNANHGLSCPVCSKKIPKMEKLTPPSAEYPITWTCNGEYGFDGCNSSGTFLFSCQFRYHVEVRDDKNQLLWN